MSEHVNNLWSIAQNDYMIDGKFLPDGVALNQAADYIKELEAIVTRMRAILDRVARESTHNDIDGPAWGCWWCGVEDGQPHRENCEYRKEVLL